MTRHIPTKPTSLPLPGEATSIVRGLLQGAQMPPPHVSTLINAIATMMYTFPPLTSQWADASQKTSASPGAGLSSARHPHTWVPSGKARVGAGHGHPEVKNKVLLLSPNASPMNRT